MAKALQPYASFFSLKTIELTFMMTDFFPLTQG